MRYFLSLLLLLCSPFFFTGCTFEPKYDYYGIGPWVKKIESTEIVHAIQHYLAYLRHEKHLRLEDSNIFYDEYVHTIRMEFTSQDILEIREARFLIVDLVEGLLAELNTNPIIAQDLSVYPLTADELEIYIDFESFYMRYIDPYFVGCLTLEGGEVTFWAATTKAIGRNKWDFRTEPYVKSRELAVYEREAEQLFEDVVEAQTPPVLKNDQYISPDKAIPRYFSPYRQEYIFPRDK